MTEGGNAAGKGKPTPKRAQSRGSRGGPVPPPPQTRREAARRVRAQNAAKRGDVRAGAKGGDQSRLLARDKGPVRQLVRDVVDSRRHPAVLLLPAALLPFAAQLLKDKSLVGATTLVWFAALVVALADFTGSGIAIRMALRRAHPEERPRGHIGYGLMRITQVRRLRAPRPTVAIGDKV